MGTITIRNLGDSEEFRQRKQAATHGRRMEDRARGITRCVPKQEPLGLGSFGTAINDLFVPFGGFDMPAMPHEPMREPSRVDG
jgi:hypothetical protein